MLENYAKRCQKNLLVPICWIRIQIVRGAPGVEKIKCFCDKTLRIQCFCPKSSCFSCHAKGNSIEIQFTISLYELRVKWASDFFNLQQNFSSFQVYLLNKFAKISSVYFCCENSRPGSLSLWVVSTGSHLWIVSFLKGNFLYLFRCTTKTFQEIPPRRIYNSQYDNGVPAMFTS